MKVCLTYVKIFKKPDPHTTTQKFVEKLVDAGMSEENSESLLDTGRVIWETDELDCKTIYADEIIKN